jgi:hypothetical protein
MLAISFPGQTRMGICGKLRVPEKRTCLEMDHAITNMPSASTNYEWTIGNIRAVPRLPQRAFSNSAQPFPLRQ